MTMKKMKKGDTFPGTPNCFFARITSAILTQDFFFHPDGIYDIPNETRVRSRKKIYLFHLFYYIWMI